MKNSIVNAVVTSIGVFVIAAVAGSLFLAGALTSSNVPSFGPASAIWDQFLFTPILFALTGTVFGWIAASNATLKTTLAPAFLTSAAVTLIMNVGTHQLLLKLKEPLMQQGVNIPVSDITGKELGMTVAAGVLWIAWFVAGATIAHGARQKRSTKHAA